MKKSLLIAIFYTFTNLVQGQIVNIPDANFKNALVNYFPVIDANKDKEIQVSEALTAKSIDVKQLTISDVTGIEAFINLQSFYCSRNQITSIDVSKNAALINFFCSENMITSINVSKNPALIYLDVSKNKLNELDVIKNTSLVYFN